MFIIWQGFGFLAALIPLIIFAAVQSILVATSFGAYIFDIAATLSAIAVWLVGSKLNGGKGKELIDPETNETVILKKKHTLFWIPMQWFAIPLIGIAVVALASHF
ncbi:hypothetical protein QJU96_06535 [Pasteurella skyensis]|uniref:hypothetical protein n=1 Tax=Phocoenobacter skyensis TaxID=97481 RepID=UPI00279070EE|nr:hypothetical protein [Pasteurella skyensis]MDP8170941.1 hypothetical protein [Pasteurella skyensis]